VGSPGITFGGELSDHPISMVPSNCRCGRCQIAESKHFRVHFCSSTEEVSKLATDCEKHLSHFHEQWFGKAEPWTIRCDIVVHPNVASYRGYLGPGSERTSGCSTIGIDKGKVTQRRIDLRRDAVDWKSESLPHEITHVALAERFSTTRIPAWADEGIAMLAESPEKLQTRLLELRRLNQQGHSIGPRKLVDLRNGPAPGMWGVFYGEAVLFTGLLLDKGTPEDLLTFIELGEKKGYSEALRKVYGVSSWQVLEADWNDYAVSDRIRRLSGHHVREPLIEQVSITDP
ncbi:MAG: hypothetical protein KDA68_20615, partial [Planctomycetaceae bacterium]|nr:hypothetical protein [Planctomycetaceae bacterium]